MTTAADQIAASSFGLAVLLYGAYAAYLLLGGGLGRDAPRSLKVFIGAVVATVGWAGFAYVAESWNGAALLGARDGFDLLRYALWLGFLSLLFRADNGELVRGAPKVLRMGAGLLVGTCATLQALSLSGFHTAVLDKVSVAATLALPVFGLLMVEQLFRNGAENVRWNAKPVCLGLACIFIFDIYLFSEGLLFGRLDADAVAVRGAAHALAVPFLFVAGRRSTDWISRLQISRAAAFHSATLILAGTYLLFMAAIGYYVRYFGGDWGRALQIGLLAAGAAVLALLVLSGSLRSWLRVFVGKHFFSYRYDYREEWLRFTALLSSNRSPQETGEMIVRGLAKMVECQAGSLWTRTEAGYVQSAAWDLAPNTALEPADSALCKFLRDPGWVIDLDEYRSSPRRYEALVLPTWLLGASNAWLIVPLLAGDDLLGFVVLVRPLTAITLNWEVLDLLKTAGRQAAGYLAQMQATEALLEARKFEAFNRMSAFVVHDLKNIVAQLSLMLKNAERLHDNREFQQDMLLTVESSLEKMRRLMLQLREGATPPGGSRGVELQPIVRRLEAMAHSQGRKLEIEKLDMIATRGHEDRLERVLGHLVQNALDATPAAGRVWIDARRKSGQIEVKVGDEGVGMSEEFVRTRLFRPFHTTKHSGMGIGTYESYQYIRELGGSLSVDSRPGEGTVISVVLPIFEAQRGSDLTPGGGA